MQIQISWLLQKPTDLDLHCLLRKGMTCLAREGLILGHVWQGTAIDNMMDDFYCAFDIFQKVVFCLALYTEEVSLQTFVMI